jgi:hypothetical protein
MSCCTRKRDYKLIKTVAPIRATFLFFPALLAIEVLIFNAVGLM